MTDSFDRLTAPLMGRRTLLAAALATGAGLVTAARADSPPLAFPGAQGWGAVTSGGRGGRIIPVTTLDPWGPGSLGEACTAKGPRIVVFEVAGEIDLKRHILSIREPYLTIAGQTAPEPGITIIAGGLDLQGHDIIVRHLRVRPGSAGAAKRSGWECDGINIDNGHHVIVDHCSTSWATDENLSAGGYAFRGANPDEWRANTGHNITLSNNLIAEGLANSTHSKGEHSKGSLIGANITDVLVVGNLYTSNRQRNPLWSAGSLGAVVNNLIVNPGSQGIFIFSNPDDWVGKPQLEGGLAVIGNVMQLGPSSVKGLAMIRAQGPQPQKLYILDNVAVDQDGAPARMLAIDGSGVRLVRESPVAIPNLRILPSAAVRASVLRQAGARPWARDPVDQRLIANAIADRGRMIDDQADVGGYPEYPMVRRRFDPRNYTRDSLDPKG